MPSQVRVHYLVLGNSLAAPSSFAAEQQSRSLKKKKPKKEVELSPPPPPRTFPTQAPVMEDLQPLSFAEQEALSEGINLLPERLLPGAMKIIREADCVNDDDGEIDLDINQLDTKTQRKLQSFVMEVRLTIPDTSLHVFFVHETCFLI